MTAGTTRPPGEDAQPGQVEPDARPVFQVRLDVFEGPFDLLLSLISKHQLDVTEVALHQVTDDFIAFIRARGRQPGSWVRRPSSCWSRPPCWT